MLDEELKELGEKISSEEMIKLEYFYKKNMFDKNILFCMEIGRYNQLIKLYYKSREELFLYLEKKKEEIENFLKEKNIISDIDLEMIAIKIFNQNYIDDDEFYKYNLLACKIALDESIKEFKYFFNAHYYLTNEIENILNFIDKILFDFNSLFFGSCFRRKDVMPGMELFAIFEEEMKGYTNGTFAKGPLKIFILRQIIELKIKNSLGIINIENEQKKKEIIINISTLFKYIKEKEEQKQMKLPIKLEVIKAMNKATNIYVHTGQFYNFYSWHEKISQILLREYCFKNHTERTHVEGSFLMTKSLLSILEDDLKKFIKKEVKFSDNIKINLKKPEVIIVDKIE